MLTTIYASPMLISMLSLSTYLGEKLFNTYKGLLLPDENTVSYPKIPYEVGMTTNIKLHLEVSTAVLFGGRLVLSRNDEVVNNFFLKHLLLRACLQLLWTHCQDWSG